MEKMTKTATIDATIVDMQEPLVKEKNRSVRVFNEKGEINTSALTVEDKQKYTQLSNTLKLGDMNTVANYGTDLTCTMSKFNDEFLKAVRAPQGGEIGELIGNLLGELSYIDVDDLQTPSKIKKIISKIPILKGMVKTLEKTLKKYDTVASNVDEIAKKISVTRLATLRDNNHLQVMFDNNIQYGKQIEDLIIAAKLKLDDVNLKIEEMQTNIEMYEAHEVQDVQEFARTLEKRIHELMTLRFIIKQSLPQIRTVQYNNIAIADKANSIITTTIPVWKNQLSIAVALQNQKGNIEAQRKVTETTNTILRKNSELLYQNSVDVARETERGVVEIETLRDTTTKLIETITEIKKIHDEGALKRKEAEAEIMKIESTLETTITGITQVDRLLK